jgi:hypothetical protein
MDEKKKRLFHNNLFPTNLILILWENISIKITNIFIGRLFHNTAVFILIPAQILVPGSLRSFYFA